MTHRPPARPPVEATTPTTGPGRSRRRPAALIAGALLLAGALPSGAQERQPAYAPCLVARAAADDYLRAFEAEGWALRAGPARDRALRGLAELRYLHGRVARHFADPPQSAEALESGIVGAEAEVADAAAGALVLARDDAVMVVQAAFPAPGEGIVTCVLTAPDLPEADRLLGSGDAVPLADTLLMAEAPWPLPPGATGLSVVAQRHTPRVTPVEPLMGLESVTVGLVVGEP